MSAVYIAEGLNSLLKTWEDFNLTREASFHYKRLLGAIMDIDKEDYFLPLVGSELNKYGSLARSIPDYKFLRDVLSGSSFRHSTNFLPKIPKDQRDRFLSLEEYSKANPIFTSVLIPNYLINWLETKRAIVVEDTAPIPLIDLRKENWLKNLPYHSFYLRINSPIVFNFKQAPDFEEKEWSLRDFLIYDDGEFINIMIWANENEQVHLTQKEQEEIEKITKQLKQGRFKTVKQLVSVREKLQKSTKLFGFSLNFAVNKETNIMKFVNVDLYDFFSEAGSIDFELLGNKPESWKELFLNAKVSLELLNGLCKLISQLPKNNSVVSIESINGKTLPDQPKKWFELNSQTIDHLETANNDDIIIIRRGTGAEKSFHVRRAHFRRYVQPDGTIKEKWVEEMYIREDKRGSEQLQGGALKVK